VYGRDNGHLALHASTLAAQSEKICPVVTLVPEFPISREHFLSIVQQIKEKYGYVCIVASEGFAFTGEEQRIDAKKRDGA
jgi:6-phosphofructokinase